MSKDIVIPIVFPDYKISVSIYKSDVDLIPWTDFDNFSIKYKEKISNLGHAGVLFINGSTGTTKYYEYGRYDPPMNIGLTIKLKNLPDVLLKDGNINLSSLKKTFKTISIKSGQHGRIQGVYIEVQNQYQNMLNYASMRVLANSNPNRRAYDLTSYSCIHFVKGVVESAGVESPWMIDPRPNSYIGEFRDDFPDLDYDFSVDKLTIEDIGEY